MANKKITDLQLISAIEAGLNFVVDNGTQTYRATMSQIKSFVLSTGAVAYATLADEAKVPRGTILDFAGSTAPTGFLLCYGQNVSRATYSDLFALIGTTYGAGDGSTTFTLPDLRGRVVAGKDDMGGSAASRITNAKSGITGTTLGAAGGNEEHTLTTTEIPSHSHKTINVADSASSTSWTIATVSGSGSTEFLNVYPVGNASEGTSGNTGGGGAHRNVQPTIILNKIIKF